MLPPLGATPTTYSKIVVISGQKWEPERAKDNYWEHLLCWSISTRGGYSRGQGRELMWGRLRAVGVGGQFVTKFPSGF